jgi:hypothetical protein
MFILTLTYVLIDNFLFLLRKKATLFGYSFGEYNEVHIFPLKVGIQILTLTIENILLNVFIWNLGQTITSRLSTV